MQTKLNEVIKERNTIICKFNKDSNIEMELWEDDPFDAKTNKILQIYNLSQNNNMSKILSHSSSMHLKQNSLINEACSTYNDNDSI